MHKPDIVCQFSPLEQGLLASSARRDVCALVPSSLCLSLCSAVGLVWTDNTHTIYRSILPRLVIAW